MTSPTDLGSDSDTRIDTDNSAEPGAAVAEDGPRPDAQPAQRRRVPNRLRWLLVVVVVIGLVVLAAARVHAAVGSQTAGDPRSATPTGSAAVAALLTGQGVELERTDDAGEAAALVSVVAGRATVVIMNPGRLSTDDVARLQRSGAARIVLVAPNPGALRMFRTGVQTGAVPTGDVLDPGCTDALALRSGAIAPDPDATGLLPPSPSAGCFLDADSGARWVRIGTPGGPVDLVADDFANQRLAEQGNAAFATGLLGSQPRLVWLMTPPPASDEPQAPGLLPTWWLLVLTQAGLGVVVAALWRGRRLGPIMVEPLPVVVRASETVEGHGRLYQRIQARDRAAAALREAARGRLGARFGRADDPDRLAELLATRTGRDTGQLKQLLNGPAPRTDDDLNRLARDLDQLEQEARQL